MAGTYGELTLEVRLLARLPVCLSLFLRQLLLQLPHARNSHVLLALHLLLLVTQVLDLLVELGSLLKEVLSLNLELLLALGHGTNLLAALVGLRGLVLNLLIQLHHLILAHSKGKGKRRM